MMRLSEVNVVRYGTFHCHDYDLGWLPAELLALWRLKGKTWAEVYWEELSKSGHGCDTTSKTYDMHSHIACTMLSKASTE